MKSVWIIVAITILVICIFMKKQNKEKFTQQKLEEKIKKDLVQYFNAPGTKLFHIYTEYANGIPIEYGNLKMSKTFEKLKNKTKVTEKDIEIEMKPIDTNEHNSLIKK